jgi:hypothetical protein
VLPARNNTPSKDIQDLDLQNSVLAEKINIPKQTDQKPCQTLKGREKQNLKGYYRQ